MTLKQLLADVRVKGICVARCVEQNKWDRPRGTERVGELAHAHLSGTSAGWICVRYPNDVLRHGSRHVSATVMHEYAHLVSGTGHDDSWRKAMADLGQVIAPRYRKRPRK